MCVQVTWKNIPKYFVLLSRNNPLMLKGLKSVDLKIIQMYYFLLKWKRYTVSYGMHKLVGLQLFWSGTPTFSSGTSSLDKQRICINTQLKSSKKQLKLNVSVPKSNSVDRYAITCDVIAYHLVRFVSICVICKYQSGIDFFFTSERTVYLNKISLPVKYFSGKTLQNGCEQLMSTRRWDLLQVQ